MTSTIHADKIMNSSGDQDSGVDLLVNDQVKLKTANTDRVTVTDATTTITNACNITGAITGSSTVQGTQFNVNGLKLLEMVEWQPGNDVNKAVDTAYDYTTTLAAGTWLPIALLNAGIFENHSNSNSTGIYYNYCFLGTAAGNYDYGRTYQTIPKWGNAANSYDSSSSWVFDPFTLGSSTTMHARWYVLELGSTTNYWVRNGAWKYRFMRIG